ncbi:MAG: alpha/beta hydrolase [Proteobacteria bacterium HN_bin10]|nr:MAG: alpha/beta hydrolase [Proteobacteria bacterium HN_bin10]
MTPQPVTIALDGGAISGLWLAPDNARVVYVFAHGAGAGMTHKSMAAIAEGLAERSIATLRYNFLYMERGSKRPDAPALAHQAVRAAAAKASALAPDLPLFAGGKSFGGRMTSQAQALEPLPNVRGLVFFAFPLHPAGRPGDERAKHLEDVQVPMLFLQGANDALATLDLLRPVIKRLGKRATLALSEGADHSFHVPAKSDRKDAEVLDEALDTAANWMLCR